MRQPSIDKEVFKRRRDFLAKKMGPSALIIFSVPQFERNYHCHFPHRQDTNLFYLTGFEEPESCLIFRPGADPETTLFVRERNEEAEMWEGFRFGTALTRELFGIDQVYRIEELRARATELLNPVDRVFYGLFHNETQDRIVGDILAALRPSRDRDGAGLPIIEDPKVLLGEMRVVKSEFELIQMRRAAEIGAEAHRNVMRYMRPDLNERQAQAHFMNAIWQQGCQREAYNPICASGANATTLHYVYNDQICRSGDLFLIDAGAEWNYYHSDITRTYPVNGRFEPLQRDLYAAVLETQKKLVALVRPGIGCRELQTTAVRLLTEILIHHGILRGSVDENIDRLTYKKYYPHGVSHFLGSDTHDAGLYVRDGKARPFEPGMVVTVEPGLYFPASDESIPGGFRGIGIRIEDDVLVTAGAPEVLTSHAPKEIGDLEGIVGSAYTTPRSTSPAPSAP